MKLGRWALGVLFILAGINHFRAADFYVAIVPPALPAPLLLVQISGVAEILLGAALFVPCFRRLAAWGIIALLLAVYPANWNMALNPERFPQFSPVILWLRLPVQLLLIGWAYLYARRTAAPDRKAEGTTCLRS